MFKKNGMNMPLDLSNPVYYEPLPDDNRKFGGRYYGKNRKAVLQEAEAMIKTFDLYRHPHVTHIYERGGWWNVEIAWYSTD